VRVTVAPWRWRVNEGARRGAYNEPVIRRALLFPLAFLLLLSSASGEISKVVVPPQADELVAHVAALTAPEMEGRASGTAGAERAAQYIADRLRALGLRPGGDGGGFLQSFVFSRALGLGPGSMLDTVGTPGTALEVGRDWMPHGGSLAEEVRGEVVFVGYAIAAGDRGRDDYAGVDVRGKIALALDGAPADLPDARSSRLEKLVAARRHGASALILVGDPLPSLNATAASVRVVSATVTSAGADRLLEPTGKTTAALRHTLATRRHGSFATGIEARIRVALQREDRRTSNVIGILPGTDPARAAEALVLGAHYDHLGRTGGHVYPGADDNASGTSLVLGLARALTGAGGTPRTLVFALFSGEEEGLLGSAHYVRRPAVSLDRTAAMLNFDMVGRMRDHRLNVGGVESGIGLRALVADAAARAAITLVPHDTPYAPSDQMSFYSAGVPVLFFFTDLHDDYHTPRDTADRINGPGMAEVASAALGIVERLGGGATPAYAKLSPPPPPAPRISGAPGGAFLGIAAEAGSDADGVRLTSVFPGSAAARAGLRAGDVLVRLGEMPVDGFAELRRTIAAKRPGQAVAVLFLRDGTDHVATVILDERP
jgi:aminopeptidase YwaD